MIQMLQDCQNLSAHTCPIALCGRIVSDSANLVEHCAIDHCVVIDLYMERIAGSQAGSALLEFKKALGFENKVCNFTVAGKSCGCMSGSKTMWLYHITRHHINKKVALQLDGYLNKTTSRGRREQSCRLCQKHVNFKSFLFHLSVEHELATSFLKNLPIAPPSDNSAIVGLTPVAHGSQKPIVVTSTSEQRQAPTSLTAATPVHLQHRSTVVTLSTPVQVSSSSSASSLIQILNSPTPLGFSALQHEESDWYFECPLCQEQFFDGVDIKTSLARFQAHLVSQHLNAEFQARLKEKSTQCPVGCAIQFDFEKDIIKHITSNHVNFFPQILASHVPSWDHENFFHKTGRSDLPSVRIEVGAKKLFEDFLSFCSERKFDSKKCEVTCILAFLNVYTKKMNPEISNVLHLIEIISEYHDPLPGTKDKIKTHRLIKNFAKKLNESSAVANTVLQHGDGCQIDPKNKENIFTCLHCNLEFKSVAHLVKHIKAISHPKEVSIGCKFCNVSFNIQSDQSTWSDQAETALVFHTFGPDHLYNRWLCLFGCRKKNPIRRTLIGPMHHNGVAFYRCEACSKEIQNVEDHIITKQHNDSRFIINFFVSFCDHRGISPITCSVDNLIFFLDYTFARSKLNRQNKLPINLHQVLVVLSLIHDPVEGQAVSAVPVIDDHITELMTNVSQPKPISTFVCYGCLFTCRDWKDFSDHLKGLAHVQTMISRVTSHINSAALRCDSCNLFFASSHRLMLHVYTKEHQDCSWQHINTPEVSIFRPSEMNETYCHLCQESDADFSHATSQMHLRREAAADLYLHHCQQVAANPVTMKVEDIITFIEERQKVDSAKDLEELIFCIDVLHEPIGDQVFMKHDFVVKLLADLKKTELPDPVVVYKDSQKLPAADESDKDEKPKDAVICDPEVQPVVDSSATSVQEKFRAYSCLTDDEVDSVIRCPVCFLKFLHATYMVYHVVHNHTKKPSKFVKELATTRNVKNCPKCTKKCTSVILLALHHDRHHLPKPLICPVCNESYLSPAQYYREDHCKKNSLPDSLKENCDRAIKNAIQQNPKTFVIGDRESESSSSESDSSDSDMEVMARKSGKVPRKPRLSSTSSSSSASSACSSPKPTEGVVSKSDDIFGIAARNRNKMEFLTTKDVKLKTDPLVVVDKLLQVKTELQTQDCCESPFTEPANGVDTQQSTGQASVASTNSFLVKISPKIKKELKRRRAPGPTPYAKRLRRSSVKGPPFNDFFSPQTGFCLECESCNVSTCKHDNHDRKIFIDLAQHAAVTMHRRFQLVKDFEMANCFVILTDVAKDPEYGQILRKRL